MNCPICKKKYDFFETHHIQSKCNGGGNEKFNLVKLCLNCHKRVHYGLIILEGWYRSTKGLMIVWHKFNEDSITGIEPPKVWLYNNHEQIKKEYINKYV